LENHEAGLDILSEAGAVSLLYLIYKRKEITTIALRDEIPGGFDRLKNVAHNLENAGLIEIETTEKPHRVRKYCLTEKGKRVAEKLAEIDRVIRENV
jgi:predicted transcriptional regulator